METHGQQPNPQQQQQPQQSHLQHHHHHHHHHQHPAQQVSVQSPGHRNQGPYPASMSSHASAPSSMHPGGGPGYNSSDPYQVANSSASPSTIHSAQSLSNGLGPPFAYGNAPNAATSTPGSMSGHYIPTDPALATSPRMLASHQPIPPLTNQQKRAYRQRRKDPSCDACRERKVKCDATDTSSCSECSSRGVKCQFTKETNRRMSSIKQVQDLEKHLTSARHQISQLKTILDRGGSGTNATVKATSVPTLRLPELNGKEHRSTPPVLDGFDDVRQNIRRYGKGAFKPPPPYNEVGSQPLCSHSVHALPPRPVADRLVSNYRGSVHLYAPHLHWPTFAQEYEELYRVGTFQRSPQIWVALFYAVLACGALMDPNQQRSDPNEETEGAQYLDKCIKSINTWNDELTMDHVRTSLLLSIYFCEVNLRSPGWVWLGTAIRIAQDIGLQIDHGHHPPLEAEMRRRVWWSVYNWDRLVSMEYGRPLMIDDDDCSVGEPTPVDDQYIQPQGIVMPLPGQSHPNGLLAVLPVVRITAQLRKTLKSQTIAATTLAACDDHFKSIMASWPEPFTIHSQAPLDPRMLTAGCSLQCMRFFLYRHNLSAACRRNDRMDALERCVSVAKDTAHYVKRTLQHSGGSPQQGYFSPGRMTNWSSQIRSMAPAFFCSHLWRCQLVLCLRCEFADAQTLAHVSLAIGDMRKNNVACGRFLAFFLDKLIARLRAGATPQTLEVDEEMLAYASGDMQGSVDDAWAWVGSDANAVPHQTPSKASDSHLADKPGLQAEQLSTSALSEREATEWGGWEHIHRTLSALVAEQRHSPGQQQPDSPHGLQTRVQHEGPPPGGAMALLAPAPSHVPQSSVSPAPNNGPAGAPFQSSRISIKDIM